MNNKSQLSVSHIFNSRLTSIISISLVLFLIGLTTLILLLTSELSVYVRENLTMSIVLKDEAKLVDIQKLQKNIDASVYAKSTELPQVLNGLGVAIISTSNGVMTDREARKNKLGGEVIAFVW